MRYGRVSRRGLVWHTAFGCNGGTCIRIAAKGSMVLIGDSKNPKGPILSYTHAEWRDFLAGAKNGDFDRILD